LKNKVLIASSSATLLLAASFFAFYLFNPTSLYKMPLEDIFRALSAEASISDSIRINKLNKTAFDLRLENPTKTIILADSSLKLSIKANYISGIGEAYRVKGIGYSYLNDIDQAIKNYIEALKCFEENNDINKQARVYNNIGLLFREINYQKALLYFNKALEISEKLNNKELIAGLYFNIAYLLSKGEDTYKAKLFLEKSNKIFTSLGDTTSMILYYQNLGVLNLKMNQLENAKKALFQAKLMAKRRNLFKILVGSNLTLTSIYLIEQKYSAAEKTIKEGIYYSNILKDSTNKYNFIYYLYEIEKAQNNHKKALQYLIKIHEFDSLLLSKNQTDNIGKTSSYYIQKQKIQENELTISKQKYKETLFWWIFTIIFSLVLITSIIGVGTYFDLQRKRKKKDIETATKIILLEQKTLQAMVNPHFIFNILNTIQYFINKKNTLEANKILAIFSRLMRKHLEICLKISITLMEEIEYLSLYLSLEKIRFTEKMEYNFTVEINIDVEETVLPPMLIQPFIENAIWHGIMPKDTGGTIDINITCENDLLQIKITDNGVGISNSMKNKLSGHISRGLELIQERIELINMLNNRNISISKIQTGESGTEVVIQIPV
jgi:tetratricopeptide (TPR) repeat protein